jgi:hypothetical protein
MKNQKLVWWQVTMEDGRRFLVKETEDAEEYLKQIQKGEKVASVVRTNEFSETENCTTERKTPDIYFCKDQNCPVHGERNRMPGWS